MIGASRAAGNHSYNYLCQASIQTIGLNDEGRAQLGRPQVGVWKEHQNNITALMI
jgi:hypothetical protein